MKKIEAFQYITTDPETGKATVQDEKVITYGKLQSLVSQLEDKRAPPPRDAVIVWPVTEATVDELKYLPKK